MKTFGGDGMRKGICCAGNMIVDITYPIETWPKQNELTHITEGITQSTWQQEYFKGIGLGVICIAAIGIVYEINCIRPRRRKRGLHEKD